MLEVDGKHRAPSLWALKLTAAITGLLWVAFVLIHLFGNLKIFAGPEAFNSYAHWLRVAFAPLLPPGFLLWTLRVALLIALTLHIGCTVLLWFWAHRKGGRRARKSWHQRTLKGRSSLQAVFASLMPFTGIVIFGFLIFHILDLTVGLAPAATEDFVAASALTSSAYENLLASFSRPAVAILYCTVMILLSIHVMHGVRTASADLGVRGQRMRRVFVWVAAAAALVILLGNGAIPIAVQLGALR